MANQEKRKAGRPPKYPKAPDAPRSAKRFQLSLPPALFDALERFRLSQDFPPERSAMVERIIERYLEDKGVYKPPGEP